MKKKILCSLLALCALLIGCGNDIEQRSLENGIVETESTEIGWNQDEEDDLSEDFSESEDQLIDFRLVDGNLYDKVKQNFEYEGYDSITLYKSIDDYFLHMQMVDGELFRNIMMIIIMMVKKILYIYQQTHLCVSIMHIKMIRRHLYIKLVY